MGRLGLEKRLERNNWPVKVILFLLSLLVIGSIYNAGKRMLVSAVVKTSPVKISVLEEHAQGEGLVFVNEDLITSPYSGKIKLHIKNGGRVGQAQVIGDFEAFGTTADGKSFQDIIKAPKAGVVLYWWDGLEHIFTEDILGTSDIDKLFEAGNTKRSLQTVGAGENIAKVINNLKDIYYVIKIPLEEFSPLPNKGDSFKIILDKFTTRASVLDIKTSSQTLYLLVKLSELPPTFYNERKAKCIIIKNEFKGVQLPKVSLISRNNSLGVYIVEAKKAHFREIELVGAVGDKVIVQKLSPLEVVILNPKWVRENEYVE